MDEKQIVLSGMRPTGKLHIGHLEGVLRDWARFQENHKCNFFVADYHAITTDVNTRELKEDAIDMVKDWIAFGIDPEKSNIFVQSYVPQHAELHLTLSMLVNLGRLERLPTFIEYIKEIVKVDDKDIKKFDEAKRANISYGFLGYPVLQAADILIYKTNFVPVGEDQLPHIELTKEIGKRFNRLYGDVFVIPEAKLGKAPRILGTDGRKMSKSYGNVISPLDSLEALSEKVKKMVTDTERKGASNPGNPYNCSVFDLQEVYDPEGAKEICGLCQSAKLACGECKKVLPLRMYDAYFEFRDRRMSLTDELVLKILSEGSEKARAIASQTMNEVKEVMMMDYLRG